MKGKSCSIQVSTLSLPTVPLNNVALLSSAKKILIDEIGIEEINIHSRHTTRNWLVPKFERCLIWRSSASHFKLMVLYLIFVTYLYWGYFCFRLQLLLLLHCNLVSIKKKKKATTNQINRFSYSQSWSWSCIYLTEHKLLTLSISSVLAGKSSSISKCHDIFIGTLLLFTTLKSNALFYKSQN